MRIIIGSRVLVSVLAGVVLTGVGRAATVDIPKLAKVEKVANPNPIWVAYKGYRLRKAPDSTETSGYPPLEYLAPARYASEYQKGPNGESYLLLVRPRSETDNTVVEHLGWVNKNYVIGNEASRDPVTTIFRKAMIVNTPQSIQNKRKITNVPILWGPDLSLSQDRTFRLFNIYFVFADTNPNPRNPDKGYILLGTRPQFDPVSAVVKPEIAQRIVLGWVPKDRVCLWDTREALEWDTTTASKRSGPAKVYAEISDAIKARKGLPGKALFEENWVAGVSRPFRYDQTRFPILHIKLSTGEMVKVRKRPEGQLYRVGVVGGFYNKEGKEVASQEKIRKFQRALRSIEDQVQKTEVVFLIDDTGSMNRWFSIVADTAQDLIRDFKADRTSSGQLSLAISYYNDAEASNLIKAVTTHKLASASSTEAREMIAELNRHQPRDGGDPREQVFYGIRKAVEQANYNPHSRKIIIILGDMGDKADENDRTHAAERKVLSSLLPTGQSPINFYAIQVTKPSKSLDARAFQVQMETLVDLYRKQYIDSFKKVRLSKKQQEYLQQEAKQRCGYVSLRDKRTVQRKIKELYRLLLQQKAEYEAAISAARRGEWARITPELKKLLHDRYNLDVDELIRAEGFQLFQFGYVWDKTSKRVPQIRHRLLVSDGELERYLKILKRMRAVDPGRRSSMKEVMQQIITTQAGEQLAETPPEERTFEKFVFRSRGFTARSPLLRRSLKDFSGKTSYIAELKAILKKIQILEAVRKDKVYDSYEFKEVSSDKLDWVGVEPARDEKRGFFIGDDRRIRWYWIDFQKEWP